MRLQRHWSQKQIMRSGLHDRDPGVAGNIEGEEEVVAVDEDGRMVVAAGEVAEVDMIADRASPAANRAISFAIALAKMMRANTAEPMVIINELVLTRRTKHLECNMPVFELLAKMRSLVNSKTWDMEKGSWGKQMSE